MSIENYHGSVCDWRKQIKENKRKTIAVIAFFVSAFFCVGGLVDVVLLQAQHPNIPIEQNMLALIRWQAIPYATLLLVGFASLCIFITYLHYDSIMLLGTNYKEITANTENNEVEQQLYHVVEEMKIAAGLNFMPKVFMIEANYMNAFASGFSEKSAMVAITRGLIEKLDRAELQAVIAHELSHIRHDDIKLNLTIAVLSNMMLIVVDVLFYSTLYKRENKREDNRLVMVIIILRYVLPLTTVLLTLFLSRTREYMADAGCVELMRDNEPLARALLKISVDHKQYAGHYAEEYGKTAHEELRQASYLFDPSDIDPIKSLSSSFSTHPSIDKRLHALGYKRK